MMDIASVLAPLTLLAYFFVLASYLLVKLTLRSTFAPARWACLVSGASMTLCQLVANSSWAIVGILVFAIATACYMLTVEAWFSDSDDGDGGADEDDAPDEPYEPHTGRRTGPDIWDLAPRLPALH